MKLHCSSVHMYYTHDNKKRQFTHTSIDNHKSIPAMSDRVCFYVLLNNTQMYCVLVFCNTLGTGGEREKDINEVTLQGRMEDVLRWRHFECACH